MADQKKIAMLGRKGGALPFKTMSSWPAKYQFRPAAGQHIGSIVIEYRLIVQFVGTIEGARAGPVLIRSPMRWAKLRLVRLHSAMIAARAVRLVSWTVVPPIRKLSPPPP